MRCTASLAALCLAGTSLLAQAPAPAPAAAPEPAPVQKPAALPRAVITGKKFDPAKLQVMWRNRRWLIVHDGQVLKDFGHAEHDARLAFRIIREFGLNEVVTIGQAGAGMEYWLASGQAPVARPRTGLRAVALQPEALRVEKFQGQWAVRDESRIICSFGDHEADARKALEVMKTHRFTQAVLLGMGVPSMTVFLVRPGEGAGPAGSSRIMKLERFPRLAKNADGTPRKNMPRGPSGLEGVAPAMVPLPPPIGRISRQSPFWRSHGMAKPAPTPLEGRVSFDWRRVQMRHEEGDWRLMAGSTLLGRFGTDAGAAKQVLSVLRYYRCTEQWGLKGEAAGRWMVAPPTGPRGVMLGLATVTVAPSKMVVVQVNGKFALAEGNRVVVPMGDSQADAVQLLELIKRHRIDRIARLGAPGVEGLGMLMRSK